MNITVEQLENLLNAQKQLCAEKAGFAYNTSKFKDDVEKADPTLINRFHEVRDRIYSAEFPEEFKIIKKYSL